MLPWGQNPDLAFYRPNECTVAKSVPPKGLGRLRRTVFPRQLSPLRDVGPSLRVDDAGSQADAGYWCPPLTQQSLVGTYSLFLARAFTLNPGHPKTP